MPKINREEYEVLKEHYDMGGEWIARDADSLLYYHKERPNKLEHSSDNVWDSNSFPMGTIGDGKKLFHFVRWADSDPYNIAELIEEYEDSKEYKDSLVIEYFMDKANESEETEVKKNIEWAKKQIDLRDTGTTDREDPQFYVDVGLRLALDFLNQLDEPKTLTPEWIDDHTFGDWNEYVYTEDLQNQLVPKQEEVNQAYKSGYETGKQHTFYKGYLEGLSDKENEPETVADVVTTFWKSYERLKEVMSMEVEELEE